MYSFVFGLLKTNLIDFSMLQSDFDDSDLKDDSLMDVDETPEVEMPVAEGETQVKTEAVEGEEVEVKEETLDESVKMEMTENEIEIKEENIPEKTENDSVRDLFQKSLLIKDFFHPYLSNFSNLRENEYFSVYKTISDFNHRYKFEVLSNFLLDDVHD